MINNYDYMIVQQTLVKIHWIYISKKKIILIVQMSLKKEGLTLKVISINSKYVREGYLFLFEKLQQVLFSLVSYLLIYGTKDSRKWQL